MINQNQIRVGNFSSSNIHKLLSLSSDKKSFGKPALTYIKQKNIERRMNIPLKHDVSTKPIIWGHFMEHYVFQNYLSMEWKSFGDTTFAHPKYSFWVGSPDFKNDSKSIIADCKAYERENFANFADIIMQNNTSVFREEAPEEYWQLVSNAIIHDCKYIQPILFMPYKDELVKVREAVENYDGWLDLHKIRFIYECVDSELPHLQDNGYYKNLISNVFEVPKEDIELLTQKVLKASELLTNYYTNGN